MKTIRNSSMSFTFAGLELHDQLEGQWPLAFLARASRYEKPALGALSWPENWPKRLKTMEKPANTVGRGAERALITVLCVKAFASWPSTSSR